MVYGGEQSGLTGAAAGCGAGAGAGAGRGAGRVAGTGFGGVGAALAATAVGRSVAAIAGNDDSLDAGSEAVVV